MTDTLRLPSLRPTSWMAATLCIALAACAQPPTAVAPAAEAAKPVAAPSTPAAYTGHFESTCQQLGEAFYTRDLIDLSEAGGGLQARYAKAIHDAEGCAPASLVVIFHMPPVQWTFDGTAQVQGRTVDRIQIRPVQDGGQLTASHARPGTLEETPTQFTLRRNGQGRGLPVDKAVEQLPTKELRLLDGARLYTSNAEGPSDTYPTEIDLEGYLERTPAP